MNFIYPGFLFAFSAVVIPIVIHFFNFRTYKKVYFSNLTFLKNVSKEKKSRTRLKHWLILLSRILAIIFLVLAFSRPYIPTENKQGQETPENHFVGIYVDNSFSMNAENNSGKLLNQAIQKAVSIVESYPPSTDFYLTTNAYKQENQQWLSQSRCMEKINHIQVSPQVKNINAIYSRQKDFLKTRTSNNTNMDIFLISDFQKSTSNFNKIVPDSTISTRLVNINPQNPSNLYIDSCWFDNPSRKVFQEEELRVKIHNISDKSYEDIQLKLLVNDSLKALNSFSIGAKRSKIVNLVYTNPGKGSIKGLVSLNDYPITFDNKIFFNYRIAPEIKVAEISENQNKYLASLFDDDYITLEHIPPGLIQPNELSQYDCIFIRNGENFSSGMQNQLRKFITNGGTIALIPNLKNNNASYNNFLSQFNSPPLYQNNIIKDKTNITDINFTHHIYKNAISQPSEEIKLPVLNTFRPINIPIKSTANSLMQISSDNHAIAHFTPERGNIYVFSFPFNKKSTNFVSHPLFVPTIYNIALFSQTQNTIYYTIGKNKVIELDQKLESRDQIFHIKQQNKNYEFIPQQIPNMENTKIKINTFGNIHEAGYYNISTQGKIFKTISYNYDRRESNLENFKENNIQQQLKKHNINNFSFLKGNREKITKEVKQISNGRQLSWLFLILTLIMIGAEIAIIRLLD